MKTIKLKESDIQRIVKKVINESEDMEWRRDSEKSKDRLYGFSEKTLIGALRHMMKIPPYDLDRIEELKNLSREELVAKLTELKGW